MKKYLLLTILLISSILIMVATTSCVKRLVKPVDIYDILIEGP